MTRYEATILAIEKDRDVLSQVCIPVDPAVCTGEDIVSQLIKTASVLDRNRDLRCSGLAANQIGFQVRILVIRRGKKYKAFINPVILKTSEFTSISEEGCFSFPGKFKKIKRYNRILVTADNTGEIKLRGHQAKAFQHEMDHLDGKLI